MKVVAKWFKSGGGGMMGILNDSHKPPRRHALINPIFQKSVYEFKRFRAYRKIILCNPKLTNVSVNI
jgi:hypothetical protein